MKKLLAIPLLIVVILTGYNVLIFYDNNFPYGRMRETPAVKPYENPMLVMASGVVPKDSAEAIWRAMDANTLVSPLPVSDAVIRRGQVVYGTFCQQCHGKNHDGNGTVGQSFTPLPTDLRSKTVQILSDGTLFQHISYGVGETNRQPALATTIRAMDRWHVIAYIKSIGIRD
jgi:mono/diheme cytochrome c family protein